jgi:integrase
MAKKRQRGFKGTPWYRSSHDRWYIAWKGKQVRIVDERGEPVQGEQNIVGATKAWEGMQGRATGVRGNRVTVREVFNLFLDHVEENTPSSYFKYKDALTSFADTLDVDEVVENLKPKQVRAWWTKTGWSQSTQGYTGRVLMSALNWACGAEVELTATNPLKGMKIPAIKSRGVESVVGPELFKEICDAVAPDFRTVLVVLRDLGCRPQAVCRVEAKDIDLEERIWTLTEHKTRGKTRRDQHIPLTVRVAEMCAEQMIKYPVGPIFRRSCGTPWTSRLISSRFVAVKDKLKKRGVKIPDAACAYGLRHARLSEMLEAGLSESLVAGVAGHTSPRVLHTNYSHILDAKDTLTRAVDAAPVLDFKSRDETSSDQRRADG